jgi:hypothetical protein
MHLFPRVNPLLEHRTPVKILTVLSDPMDEKLYGSSRLVCYYRAEQRRAILTFTATHVLQVESASTQGDTPNLAWARYTYSLQYAS